MPLQPIPPVVPWSAKRASWLIVKKPPDLDDDEKAARVDVYELVFGGFGRLAESIHPASLDIHPNQGSAKR